MQIHTHCILLTTKLDKRVKHRISINNRLRKGMFEETAEFSKTFKSLLIASKKLLFLILDDRD